MSGELAGIIFLTIYFAPTINALFRNHKSLGGIIVINVFLGWTMIGWIIALAWAGANPR